MGCGCHLLAIIGNCLVRRFIYLQCLFLHIKGKIHHYHLKKNQVLDFDLRSHCNYIVAFLLIYGYDCWLEIGALENILELNYSLRIKDAFL